MITLEILLLALLVFELALVQTVARVEMKLIITVKLFWSL